MWREEECARQWRGLQGWYAYIYMYVPNQCLHPLHRGLAVIPHPRCIWSPFHGDGHQSLHIQLWHGCMDISLTPTLMGA